MKEAPVSPEGSGPGNESATEAVEQQLRRGFEQQGLRVSGLGFRV